MIYFLPILATAYFGLNFNPATTNIATESRIYPVAPSVYRMIQPDGVVRHFDFIDTDEGVLVGPKPWLGVIKDRRIDIWADPKYTGGKLRTAFTFIAGRLKLMVLDGKRYTAAKFLPQDGKLESFFPKHRARQYEKNSKADIWREDSSRLRMWFANPNSAGILFAELFIMCIYFLTKTKGMFRIFDGILSITFLYCLSATGSRGALLGAALGVGVIIFTCVRNLFSIRALAFLLLGLIVLSTGIVVSGNAKRLASTFTSIDGGNARRLKIGVAAIKMFADAPTGWRGGEVPGRNACLNWYVFDEPNSLRTHLMSLAESGWFKGYFYVFFWLLILVSGIALARKGKPLPVSLWVSFGLAGCLNPVYKDWETWILPMGMLGTFAFSGGRFTIKQWRILVIVSALLSLTVIPLFISVGKIMKRPTSVSVCCNGNVTLINGKKPRVWVVGDPLVMGGGGFPGREILAYCSRNRDIGCIAYVYDVKDLPPEAESVIVSGRNASDYLKAYKENRACKASRLLFLSASVGPDVVPQQLLKESNILWVVGSLLADCSKSYSSEHEWVKIIPGCERYIPKWVDFLSQ